MPHFVVETESQIRSKLKSSSYSTIAALYT